jgi:hypothetical protein
LIINTYQFPQSIFDQSIDRVFISIWTLGRFFAQSAGKRMFKEVAALVKNAQMEAVC